jgi:hypothetical protein
MDNSNGAPAMVERQTHVEMVEATAVLAARISDLAAENHRLAALRKEDAHLREVRIDGACDKAHRAGCNLGFTLGFAAGALAMIALGATP